MFVCFFFSSKDIDELNELKNIFNKNSVFFIKIPSIENFKSPASSLGLQTPTTNEYAKFLESIQNNKMLNVNLMKYLQQQSLNQANQLISCNLGLFKNLCDLKFLNIRSSTTTTTTTASNDTVEHQSEPTNEFEIVLNQVEQQFYENEYCEKWYLFFYYSSIHFKRQFRYLCIHGTTVLYKFHEKCLNSFINFAYDLARDMVVTPRKLEYAREKEQVLFDSLNSLASMKQDELKILINNSIDMHRESILNAARQYQFMDTFNDNDSDYGNSSERPNSVQRKSSITVKYVKDFKTCTQQIQELVITKLNNAISKQITDSVEVLKENYIGTLKRCLESLEDMNGLRKNSDSDLDSLQNSDSSSSSSKTMSIESASASEALKQILHSAYQVEVTLTGSSNIIKVLIERMKEVTQRRIYI